MNTQEQINFFITHILGIRTVPQNVKFEEIEELLFPQKQYKIIELYGSGTGGMVFKVQDCQNRQFYALKVVAFMDSEEKIIEEFKIQEYFSKFNMAPRVYDFDVLKDKFRNISIRIGRCLMDPIQSNIRNYLYKQNNIRKLLKAIKCLMIKKYILGYPESFLHGDMHIDNIVLLKDGKTLGFIDFGFGVQKSSILQILDCIPLVSSIKFSDCGNRKYREQVCKDIIKLYNQMFNIRMEYDAFERHPGGGYTYKKWNILLHSYDWIPYRNRKPLSNEQEIREVFPTIQPPRVV